MATKTISVSPEFFGNKIKKKSKTRKKHKIRDNINILQKNFLKEQMIDKIKKFKKKRKSKIIATIILIKLIIMKLLNLWKM